jgi:hypothetical protein
LLAEQWASALGVAAETLEKVIFTDGLPGDSSWRSVEQTRTMICTKSESSRTCADAIARVLAGAVGGMRAADIAGEINRRSLYRRRDGQSLPAYQVSSIAHANRSRFRVTDGVITLSACAAVGVTPSRAGLRASTSRPRKSSRTSAGSRVILLGCVKQKLDHRAPAKELYRSPLWKARRGYAEASGLPCVKAG